MEDMQQRGIATSNEHAERLGSHGAPDHAGHWTPHARLVAPLARAGLGPQAAIARPPRLAVYGPLASGADSGARDQRDGEEDRRVRYQVARVRAVCAVDDNVVAGELVDGRGRRECLCARNELDVGVESGAVSDMKSL